MDLFNREEVKRISHIWDVYLNSMILKQEHDGKNDNTKIKDISLYTNYCANKQLQDEIIKKHPKLAPAQILQKQLDIIRGKYESPDDIKLRKQWLQKRMTVSATNPQNLAQFAPENFDINEIENYEKFVETGIRPAFKNDFDIEEFTNIYSKLSKNLFYFAAFFEKEAQKLTGNKSSPF